MQIYNRYIYRSLFIATFFVSFILIAITMLTQSLRFLELIVESGASTRSFWILTFLSLPRFFEVIIPLSLATAVLFVFNKLNTDSELAVLKATGQSFFQITRPVIYVSLIITVFLMAMSTWFAPVSLSKLQFMKQIVRAEFSTLLFREGVFNNIGKGLTVYIRNKTGEGEFEGLIIQDERDDAAPVRTVFAKRGVLVENKGGQEIVVFNGARHDFNTQEQKLNRLNFERYTISLPEDETTPTRRWREPDERTFFELLRPDAEVRADAEKLREFRIEAHKRILGPLLAPVYCLVAVCFLLLGAYKRQGKLMAIMGAAVTLIILQALYIAAMNAATKSDLGLYLAYGLWGTPLIVCIILLVSAQRGGRL